MKKQRILVVLLALVMVLTAVFFTGCQKAEPAEFCQITVILGDKTYQVETECRTLHEVLQEMKEDGVITVYEFSGTQFSPYVTKVDGVEDTYSVDGKYIAVFHNIEDAALQQFSTSTWQPITIELDGKTFYYSYVGVALLPVVDGAVYYLFATSEFYY